MTRLHTEANVCAMCMCLCLAVQLGPGLSRVDKVFNCGEWGEWWAQRVGQVAFIPPMPSIGPGFLDGT